MCGSSRRNHLVPAQVDDRPIYLFYALPLLVTEILVVQLIMRPGAAPSTCSLYLDIMFMMLIPFIRANLLSDAIKISCGRGVTSRRMFGLEQPPQLR